MKQVRVHIFQSYHCGSNEVGHHGQGSNKEGGAPNTQQDSGAIDSYCLHTRVCSVGRSRLLPEPHPVCSGVVQW